MKTVALLIAHHGYQPIEYGTPKKLLEAAGFDVVTVSNGSGVAIASDESETNIDIALENFDSTLADALYLVGGPGALENLDNEVTYNLLQAWQETGKPYGAICISPRILAKAGVLKGKEATGWDGDDELETIFAYHEVTYKKEAVVVSADIITADGPSSAEAFGKKIIELLQ